MLKLYLRPPLPHQQGMVARPEFGCPAERHYEVPRDHAGCRPVCPCGTSWVRDGNPGLFDRHTGDLPPGDLRRGPLKEGREEDILQHILYPLKIHPYVRGDAFYEGPLCTCSLANI